MKRKQLIRAVGEALALVADLEVRLPAACPVPPEEVFATVWPLACLLTRLKRLARKNAKAAKAYRRLRAEVAEELRTKPDGLVPLAALLNTVPLDPDCWRTALVPGASADALEAA